MEPKICYWMKGLPASGKSTLSAKILAEDPNAARCNRDSIRAMLKNNKGDLKAVFNANDLRDMLFKGLPTTAERVGFATALSSFLSSDLDEEKDNVKSAQKAAGRMEPVLIRTMKLIQMAIIRFIVSKGKNVIVDDTNFHPQNIVIARGLCRGYRFKIIDMHREFGITIDECVERNKKRDTLPDGDKIIREMAERYEVQKTLDNPTKNKPFVSKRKLVIFDLDGTLTDCSARIHFVTNNEKNWDAFFGAIHEDPPRDHVVGMLEAFRPDYDIVIMSGRPEFTRAVTEKWLADWGIEYDALIMRYSNDRRSDSDVKQELLDMYLQVEQIEYAIDDRQSVIEVWRRNGIKVIDVGEK